MENKLDRPPKTLYRGIKLKPTEVGLELLTQDLLPGSTPKIDDKGRETVQDGNEYGVYMSSNPSMVDAAYAYDRKGYQMPDSPYFKLGGIPGVRMSAPKVGITYQIDTEDIDMRRPFITKALQGVYNNGFEGEEWIADSIPATNHKITRLTIGGDTLHKRKDIEVGEKPEEAFEDLRLELDRRMGRLALACNLIEQLSPSSRLDEWRIKQILTEISEAAE